MVLGKGGSSAGIPLRSGGVYGGGAGNICFSSRMITMASQNYMNSNKELQKDDDSGTEGAHLLRSAAGLGNVGQRSSA
jgi:hypothetical protein